MKNANQFFLDTSTQINTALLQTDQDKSLFEATVQPEGNFRSGQLSFRYREEGHMAQYIIINSFDSPDNAEQKRTEIMKRLRNPTETLLQQ